MSEPAKKGKPAIKLEGQLSGLFYTPRTASYQIEEPSGRIGTITFHLPQGEDWNHLDVTDSEDLPDIDLIDIQYGLGALKRLPIEPSKGKALFQQFWNHTHFSGRNQFQASVPNTSEGHAWQGGKLSTRRSRNRMAKGSRKNTRKANRKAKDSRKASRKTQSGGRKMSDWNKSVKRVYEEMKRKNSNASFGDALKEASKRKKAGNL